MLVICEDCAKKYNIDESRIKARRARFTCNECGHIIIIDKADLSRPLISQRNPGYSPSSTIDLLREMEGPLSTGSSGETETLREHDEPGPPKQEVQRNNRGAPLFVYSVVTMLLSLICAGLGTYYLYTEYLPADDLSGKVSEVYGAPGAILKPILLFGTGWFVTSLFFSLFAHYMLQKFNVLVKHANQLGSGTDDIAISKKGPREVRNLAFALERIRNRFRSMQ